MNCDAVRRHLSLEMIDSAVDRRGLLLHLRSCGACAALAPEILPFLAELAAVSESVPVGAARRFLADVRPATAPPRHGFARPRVVLTLAAGLAAVALLVMAMHDPREPARGVPPRRDGASPNIGRESAELAGRPAGGPDVEFPPASPAPVIRRPLGGAASTLVRSVVFLDRSTRTELLVATEAPAAARALKVNSR